MLQHFKSRSKLRILFVAAGLLANAVRALHEAGIWNGLQQTVYDVSSALPTDSAFGSVLSGLLGYQDTANLGEVLTYLASEDLSKLRGTLGLG